MMRLFSALGNKDYLSCDGVSRAVFLIVSRSQWLRPLLQVLLLSLVRDDEDRRALSCLASQSLGSLAPSRPVLPYAHSVPLDARATVRFMTAVPEINAQ